MRALCGAAALGSSVGLAIGGAYFLGGVAKASVTTARLQTAGPVAVGTLDGLQPSATVQLARSPVVAAPIPVARAKPFLVAILNRRSSPIVPVAPFALRDKADDNRDLECLTQAVYYEARGESDSGQAAVAQVVLNRTRHPRFPKSVCAVVFQHAGAGCQFSFACDSQVRHPRETAAWRRSEKVAQRALGGYVMADVGAATDFRGGQGAPAGLLKVAQIGGHAFYRFAGRLGGSQALTGQVLASTSDRPHVVFASFAPPAELLAASAKVVERAAAAVEAVGKPAVIAAPAPAPAVVAPAKAEETKVAVVSSPAPTSLAAN